MNDESRPQAAPEIPAKRSTTTVQVTGRITLDLRRYVDDMGWLPDTVRAEMVWRDIPDGVELIIDIGRAGVWPSWVWSPLGEPDAPRFARIDVRGSGNVGMAVRDIRAVLDARDD